MDNFQPAPPAVDDGELREIVETWLTDDFDPRQYLAARESFSTAVAANGHPRGADQPVWPTPQWQLGHGAGNQDVRTNINRSLEAFARASLLSNTLVGGFVEYENIFISPRYPASLITESTLNALGWECQIVSVKKCYNPRGGRFQSVGITRLYLKFRGREPAFVNFLVLDVHPQVLGTCLIIGKPAINRILGAGWTPAQAVEL